MDQKNKHHCILHYGFLFHRICRSWSALL